jgi:hypothetical protein
MRRLLFVRVRDSRREESILRAERKMRTWGGAIGAKGEFDLWMTGTSLRVRWIFSIRVVMGFAIPESNWSFFHVPNHSLIQYSAYLLHGRFGLLPSTVTK